MGAALGQGGGETPLFVNAKKALSISILDHLLALTEEAGHKPDSEVANLHLFNMSICRSSLEGDRMFQIGSLGQNRPTELWVRVIERHAP